jgi:hypothetical protein
MNKERDATVRRFLPVLTVGCLLAGGCATAPEVDTMIQEAPKGAVYLERIPDRAVQTSHPITLDRELIARTFRGVLVRDDTTAVQKLMSHKPAPVRAFSEEDIVFLAPFVTRAFAQAATDQQIGFRVHNYPATLSYSQKAGAAVGSSEPPLAQSSLLETTAGYMLVRDRSLSLTLTQFRTRRERADTINMANRRIPDPSGQADRELYFVPVGALRHDTAKKSLLFGSSPETTFVIDYAALAQLPASEDKATPTATQAGHPAKGSPTPPGATEVRDQDLQQIKDDINKKNAEVEALKKEMEDIRRELGKPAPKSP